MNHHFIMQMAGWGTYLAGYMWVKSMIWQQEDRNYDEKLRKFNEENGYDL